MEEKKKREGENAKEYQKRMNDNILKYKQELLNKIRENKKNFVDNDVDFVNDVDIFAQPLKNLKKRDQQISIIIDGPTLGLILGDEGLERTFLSIGLYSKSVVC